MRILACLFAVLLPVIAEAADPRVTHRTHDPVNRLETETVSHKKGALLLAAGGALVAHHHLDAWGRYRLPAALDASRNRYGFTGYLFDQETGLYFAKARLYDPAIGRFTTQDSVLGKAEEPPSLNRYAYGNANPLRFVDPTGHQTVGAEYCRAYTCSPTTRHAVDPVSRVADPVNHAIDKAGDRAFFFALTGVAHGWNATLGNAGHGSQPDAGVRYPEPKDDVDAWLGVAAILTVDVAPALAPAGRSMAGRSRSVSRELAPLEARSVPVTEISRIDGPVQVVDGMTVAELAPLDRRAPPHMPTLSGTFQAADSATAPSRPATKHGPGRFVAKHESMSAEARAYEEAVAGSPPGQTYRIPYANPNPRGRPYVDFDGVQRGVPVDAKVSIVTRQKTVGQAARQAEALRQTDSIGVWKVPSVAEAQRARAVIERAGAGDRLFVVVEKPQ